MIQIPAAFDWLVAHEAEALCDVRFVVNATTHGSGTAHGSSGRGIYLREPQHTAAGEVACSVFIKPTLHEDAPNSAKVALDVQCNLLPSAAWVTCAPSVALTNGGRGFDLKLSIGQLPPGCHFAEVIGTDAANPALGALFRVPITVIKPHANLMAPAQPFHGASGRTGCSYSYGSFLPFTPGLVERRFVVPPAGATWATLTLEARGALRSRDLAAGPVLFMYHLAQLIPSVAMRHTEHSGRVSLGIPTDEAAPPTQWVTSVAVTGGVTLEVTIAQWWMSLGETELSMTIDFYGLQPSSGTAPLLLDGRELFGSFEIHSPFRRTPAAPSGELSRLERAVRPTAAKLVPPVAPLDGAPGFGDTWAQDKRVLYDYLLKYTFSIKEATTVDVKFPSLCCQLYESPYDAQVTAGELNHSYTVATPTSTHRLGPLPGSDSTPSYRSSGGFSIQISVCSVTATTFLHTLATRAP